MLLVLDQQFIQDALSLWKNRQFLLNVYQIHKHTTSLNHLILMIMKQTQNLDFSLDESRWKTFSDCKRHLQQTWPYLIRIDSTTTPLNETSDEFGQERQSCVNFSSYSYVGAIKELQIRDFVFDEMKKGHYAFGNHGPRMLGGNNFWLCKLERELANFTGREAALCFSSGFLACKTAIQAVADRGDVIFGDGRLHESLRDGIRCAKNKGCMSFMFKHNNFEHLEELLKEHRSFYKAAYIIVESVYSMDGDFTDLNAVSALAKNYNAKIILDEAHGLGIIGKTGRGLEELQNCIGVSWMIVGSLTKALGSVGGYVCASQEIVDFLHFFATGTMFSAPMSIPNTIAAWKTLEQIQLHPEWLEETHNNMTNLTTLLKPLEIEFGVCVQTVPYSPLIAFIMKDFDPERVLVLATKLRKLGFYVAAVNTPACPLREPRLRITAPRGTTCGQILQFVLALRVCCEETKHIRGKLDTTEVAKIMDLLGIQ